VIVGALFSLLVCFRLSFMGLPVHVYVLCITRIHNTHAHVCMHKSNAPAQKRTGSQPSHTKKTKRELQVRERVKPRMKNVPGWLPTFASLWLLTVTQLPCRGSLRGCKDGAGTQT
jgi:hypothetical protein